MFVEKFLFSIVWCSFLNSSTLTFVSEGVNEDVALVQAVQECTVEEEKEVLALNQRMNEEVQGLVQTQLGEIKNRYSTDNGFVTSLAFVLILNFYFLNTCLLLLVAFVVFHIFAQSGECCFQTGGLSKRSED